MSTIRFEIEWCDPISVDIPADASLGELVIWVDDDCVTRNLTTGTRANRESFRGVFGNLSGVADWCIENWAFLVNESITPFPRSAFPDGASDHAVPGLRDAELGWMASVEAGVSVASLADWQHRHTVGHATSELALPSLVVVPESNDLILAIDSPAARLNATTHFINSRKRRREYTMYVVRSADFLGAVSGFIDEVLERLAKFSEASKLTEWMCKNWDDARKQAQDPGVIARIQFGKLASQELMQLERVNSHLAGLVKDTLADCPMIGSHDELEHLANTIVELGETTNDVESVDPIAWNGVTSDGPDYQQGYRLAQVVRGKFQLGNRPIKEMVSVLNRGGLAVKPEVNSTLFRSLAVPCKDETRSVVVSSIDVRASTPNGHRFALAATLGRALWDQATESPNLHALAHGDFARISRSRRANAFAAELLLPREVFLLRLGGTATSWQIRELAEEYGIANSAATWHAQNQGVKLMA